ncbi:MAG: RNA polymerase sigma factor [Ruminococcaceae bacterium]|nr:RNA polymerase sigma factor [Oscillospiraceae bacterium]
MADIERLYGEYYGFIYKYLLGFCHDENLAEELTAETFFRAYINIASLRSEEKAPVWLCSIAKHLYYAHYNENRKRVGMEAAEEIADESDPAEEVANKILASQVLRQVGRLKEPYRDVFLLSVLGQRSLKDICLLYGKSESWARVTFFRAKQIVIMRMEENDEL